MSGNAAKNTPTTFQNGKEIKCQDKGKNKGRQKSSLHTHPLASSAGKPYCLVAAPHVADYSSSSGTCSPMNSFTTDRGSRETTTPAADTPNINQDRLLDSGAAHVFERVFLLTQTFFHAPIPGACPFKLGELYDVLQHGRPTRMWLQSVGLGL
uniref:Uncharacterized protein n=1 Tax=Trypanosoma vivax (strain Y486) TaxID=1055687 RepID=G0UB37_TRYVY|nr:hypothetical protein, unlikely [Trypanosoma vivax Y486]